jgi:protoheme IX farnesyltransferase
VWKRSALAATAAIDSVPPIGMMGMARAYYELTKPGISQMVAMSTLAGYYLAIPGDFVAYAQGSDHWIHFGATMLGTLAISSGSCVANHVMERDIDARMKRTAARPIPSGTVSVQAAVVLSAFLTLAGVGLLASVNMLTLILAIATWVMYVFVYTPMKTRSSLAVIVGGIPGALPFAGGWTAVTGSADLMAWILFGILFMWQLPHFYALSWMYRADYREGGFVLRAIRDDNPTALAWQIIITSILTTACAVMPTIVNVTGWLYGVGAFVLGSWLVVEGFRFKNEGTTQSARRVLLTSYAVLMGVMILMFLDKR